MVDRITRPALVEGLQTSTWTALSLAIRRCAYLNGLLRGASLRIMSRIPEKDGANAKMAIQMRLHSAFKTAKATMERVFASIKGDKPNLQELDNVDTLFHVEVVDLLQDDQEVPGRPVKQPTMDEVSAKLWVEMVDLSESALAEAPKVVRRGVLSYITRNRVLALVTPVSVASGTYSWWSWAAQKTVEEVTPHIPARSVSDNPSVQNAIVLAKYAGCKGNFLSDLASSKMCVSAALDVVETRIPESLQAVTSSASWLAVRTAAIEWPRLTMTTAGGIATSAAKGAASTVASNAWALAWANPAVTAAVGAVLAATAYSEVTGFLPGESLFDYEVPRLDAIGFNPGAVSQLALPTGLESGWAAEVETALAIGPMTRQMVEAGRTIAGNATPTDLPDGFVGTMVELGEFTYGPLYNDMKDELSRKKTATDAFYLNIGSKLADTLGWILSPGLVGI